MIFIQCMEGSKSFDSRQNVLLEFLQSPIDIVARLGFYYLKLAQLSSSNVRVLEV